jgi:hypothetical protein
MVPWVVSLQYVLNRFQVQLKKALEGPFFVATSYAALVSPAASGYTLTLYRVLLLCSNLTTPSMSE